MLFQFLNEKILVVSLEGMKAFYEGQGHIRYLLRLQG
jgi:hypothetical protein